MKAYLTMVKTEIKLSLRGMDMFIFAICLPLVALGIIGAIYQQKPAFPGAHYTFLQQSFGALTTISICAGGVMGLPLVVSDYRSKKILKRLKVTPASPAVILLASVTMYAFYAYASLLTLWLVAKVFFGYVFPGSVFLFLLSHLMVMVSMFSIGMMIGGLASNTKIAGVLASLLYFPMLIFSGASLPYEAMPDFVQKVANILPLTQGIKLVKAATLGLPLNTALTPMIVMVVTAALCTFAGLRFFKWE